VNKIQVTIFLVILLIFGVLFYATQAKYLGLNTTPKGQISISQIPDQMNFSQDKANPNQLQQQGQIQGMQGQQQQQQQAQPAQTTFNKAELDPYKTASATAVIKTSKGDITLDLYGDAAPYTVANFIKKAKDGFYNNLTFHRVEDWVVQGGDPLGNGTGGGSMPVEFNDKPFVTGSVGVASTGDGKTQNDSQFFITKKDASYLNGQYTNFGMVTDGMDVVNKLAIGDKILGIDIQEPEGM
jgi:cyclophilin family peptidyl-prolyl cis-trans isomerase